MNYSKYSSVPKVTDPGLLEFARQSQKHGYGINWSGLAEMQNWGSSPVGRSLRELSQPYNQISVNPVEELSRVRRLAESQGKGAEFDAGIGRTRQSIQRYLQTNPSEASNPTLQAYLSFNPNSVLGGSGIGKKNEVENAPVVPGQKQFGSQQLDSQSGLETDPGNYNWSSDPLTRNMQAYMMMRQYEAEQQKQVRKEDRESAAWSFFGNAIANAFRPQAYDTTTTARLMSQWH